MKKKLIDILESLGYPVFLQGSLGKDEPYPESFFTFWNYENPETSHYNNSPVACTWSFAINFYSSDPKLVETESLKAKNLLKQNGFVLTGKPCDISSDEPTHTGATLTCYILETY